ncbi:hypothetical protein ABIB38_004089, partial [Massilia sp. UYP11]|uniref:hypothetical protein n=1 Tax=Massilia sp. UYP11 TaxID=1756385 RepID=UPI003D2370C1
GRGLRGLGHGGFYMTDFFGIEGGASAPVRGSTISLACGPSSIGNDKRNRQVLWWPSSSACKSDIVVAHQLSWTLLNSRCSTWLLERV